MVLGVLLLRDSRFDHFGDAAGGKQEGESMILGDGMRRGKKENLRLTAKQRDSSGPCFSGQC
jgi:hypothetical protein